MIAHMTLGMIAPIGLVLGAPITLALRTLPQGRTPDERGPRATLVALLHSRVGVLFTNPVIALALFDGSLFVLYFTDLFGNLMSSHAGHLLMNIHFILAGFLFFMIVIGVDPSPRRIHHLVRIVILFAAMAIHAFFSIALLSTTTLIDKGYYASQNAPWLGLGVLDDQRAGGSVSWAMGEIPIILALIAPLFYGCAMMRKKLVALIATKREKLQWANQMNLHSTTRTCNHCTREKRSR